MKQIVRSFHIGNLLGVLKLRKLEALKVGGVQKEEIKRRNKCVLLVGKVFFSLLFVHYFFSFAL
jgi:hypothetical protein